MTEFATILSKSLKLNKNKEGPNTGPCMIPKVSL